MSYTSQSMPNVYDLDVTNIQEVISYCEARFRAALKVITSPNYYTNREIYCKTLASELQLCLSKIGLASALGHVVNIPILIRTLAADFHQSRTQPGSLFTKDMRDVRQIIDAGPDPDAVDAAVTDFALSWWLEDIDPILHFLNEDSITFCLDFHRTAVRNMKGKRADRQSESASLGMLTYSWHWSALADVPGISSCTRCRLYRSLALGTWDKLRDLRSVVHAAQSQYNADTTFSIRRASGFNELYERVIVKEMSGTDDIDEVSKLVRLAGADNFGDESGIESESKTMKQQAIEGWRLISQKRREKQQEVVPELKWTWGVELTEDELREMAHGADQGLVLPHSGYDESLPDDISLSKYSSLPNIKEFLKEGDAPFLPLSSDIMAIPDLQPHQYPIEFSIPSLNNEGYTKVPSGFLRKERRSKKKKAFAAPGQPSSSARPWFRLPPDEYVQLPSPDKYVKSVLLPEIEHPDARFSPSKQAESLSDDDEISAAAIAAVALAPPGYSPEQPIVIDSDDERSNFLQVVTDLQHSSDSELDEAAAAAMDLTSEYEDESAGSTGSDDSDFERMDIPGPYTASSFPQFQDDWLGSD